MFNIHAVYSPADIKDTIGWADHPTIGDLVQAIMVLCDAVKRLEDRVATLEPKAKEYLTWTDLVTSGELTGYVPTLGSDIDAEAVTNTTCGQCQGRCKFIAMRNGDSYRAFAVCKNPLCDAAFEF